MCSAGYDAGRAVGADVVEAAAHGVDERLLLQHRQGEVGPSWRRDGSGDHDAVRSERDAVGDTSR